jgi:lysophospholipase L1-like esterase
VEEHLFTRHPRELYPETPNERLRQANKIIREVAAEFDCKLVDLDPVFAPGTWEEGNPDGLLRTVAASGKPDGVNVNEIGAERIAEAVAETVKSLSLPGGRVICLGDSITYGGDLPGAGTAEGETYPAFLSQILNGTAETTQP